MNSAPWAKLMILSMPKMIARPNESIARTAVDQAQQVLAEAKSGCPVEPRIMNIGRFAFEQSSPSPLEGEGLG